jgi:hypothetical protein
VFQHITIYCSYHKWISPFHNMVIQY